MTTPQEEFDRKYITSSEITSVLGISRSSLMEARKKGKLPGAIYLQRNLYIWERAVVGAYLQAWKTIIEARKATAQ